jgi:hypothetical protein
MREAFKTAAHFFAMNLREKGPRATRRHNWRWCLFVAMDILVNRFPSFHHKSGTIIILVNRLGEALVSKPLVEALYDDHKTNEEPFLVLGDESWRVLGDTLYKNITTRFIRERSFDLIRSID